MFGRSEKGANLFDDQGQGDNPIYRIHMIGLGEEKPVDEGHNRAARAKNRRVEVKVFTADQVTASLGESATGGSASRAAATPER